MADDDVQQASYWPCTNIKGFGESFTVSLYPVRVLVMTVQPMWPVLLMTSTFWRRYWRNGCQITSIISTNYRLAPSKNSQPWLMIWTGKTLISRNLVYPWHRFQLSNRFANLHRIRLYHCRAVWNFKTIWLYKHTVLCCLFALSICFAVNMKNVVNNHQAPFTNMVSRVNSCLDK